MSAPQIVVTGHAIARWRERVDPAATAEQARHALSGPAVTTALRFGARVIRIGRFRVILRHTSRGLFVITVLGPDFDCPPHELRPVFQGGPPPIASLFPKLAPPAGDRR